jgi:hypothetical protein
MSSDQAVTATFTTATPKSKPSCTLAAKSAKVLLPSAKKRRHQQGKPGTLQFTIRCNQPASIKLTGKLTETTKRKHHKKHTKTITLKALHATTSSGVTKTLPLRLPKAALVALAHGTRESLTVTLSASNRNGTSTTTKKLARLKT